MIYNMTWHDYYINKQRNGKILIYNRISVSPNIHTYMICNIWYDIMMYQYAREWCTIYVTWCDMIDVSVQKGMVKKSCTLQTWKKHYLIVSGNVVYF